MTIILGNTDYHEELERQLAEFEQKEDAILLNFGYQGILSAIDALVDRRDIIVYDAESHACIIDGVRLHQGKRFVYAHNDIENLEKQLIRATKMAEEQGGAILVITEGVFGMSGNQGKLREVVELKSKFEFRLLLHPMIIDKNAVVGVHYELDVEGQKLDASGDQPLVYLHGHGMMIPGFEKQLAGLKAGDKYDFIVIYKYYYIIIIYYYNIIMKNN